MARISSPRHPLHCRLRLPRSREKPFFPLCKVRPPGTTPHPTSCQFSAPRIASAPNGIIQTRSLPSVSGLPDSCQLNFPAALSVRPCVCNTVVLRQHKENERQPAKEKRCVHCRCNVGVDLGLRGGKRYPLSPATGSPKGLSAAGTRSWQQKSALSKH